MGVERAPPRSGGRIPGSKPRWSADCLPSRSAQDHPSGGARSRTRKRSGLSRAALPRWRTWAKVVPDGVEPSFPGCRPGVVAVGPRDRVSQVESPGIAPGSPACGAGVVLLDHDPNVSLQRKPWGSNPQAARLPPPTFQAGSSTIRMASVIMSATAEAVGLEPTSGSQPPPVFRTGSSSGRMASVVELRRLDLNQHEDVQSVSSCRWMTPHRCCLAKHGSQAASSGRRGRTSVAWFKARGPTASRSPITFQSALRESNPPVQLGRLMPCANRPRAHKAEGEGVEPPRLIARPLSGRLPSPVGLTFRIQ